MDTSSIITGTTLNRYQLDIPSCTASLDVEEFSGAEKLSELYYYTITFTSAEKNIDAAQLLSKPAMLTMGGGALQQQFRRSVAISDNPRTLPLLTG